MVPLLCFDKAVKDQPKKWLHAPSADNEAIALSASLGKLTILDFWASWCGPCRIDSPNLVRVHNTFKNNGLAIVGISLDI